MYKRELTGVHSTDSELKELTGALQHRLELYRDLLPGKTARHLFWPTFGPRTHMCWCCLLSRHSVWGKRMAGDRVWSVAMSKGEQASFILSAARAPDQEFTMTYQYHIKKNDSSKKNKRKKKKNENCLRVLALKRFLNTFHSEKNWFTVLNTAWWDLSTFSSLTLKLWMQKHPRNCPFWSEMVSNQERPKR